MSDELRLDDAVNGLLAFHARAVDHHLYLFCEPAYLDARRVRQLHDYLAAWLRRHEPRHCSEDTGEQLADRDGAESIAAAVAHFVAEEL